MKRDWILILVLLAGCGAAGYAFYADATARSTAENEALAETTVVPTEPEPDDIPEGMRPIAYPYWDKKEPVEAYAKRAGLPPEIAFDLGGGVRLEMVLVPAGKAELGTPEPDRPAAVWRGSLAFLCGVVAFALTILGSVLHARRNNTRVQFSLRWLLLMASAASMALIGALHWRELSQQHDIYRTQLQLWRTASARTEEFDVPFYLAKYETTNAQYARMRWLRVHSQASTGPSAPDADLPATEVDGEADLCLNELSKLTEEARAWGRRSRFRLPTSSEWEYACRAGHNTIFHSGDRTKDLGAVAWWSGNSGGHAHPVGQKTPNAFGLYDMHGNAAELCDVGLRRKSPLEPYTSYRGGAFLSDELDCAASMCWDKLNFTSFRHIGFRILLYGPATEEQRAEFLEWLETLKKKDAAPRAPRAP